MELYLFIFIWIGGPWTSWRSPVCSLKRGRQTQFCAARGRCALRRNVEERLGLAWEFALPSASHSSYADRHTTWRTRIVGRRARIQRRNRSTLTSRKTNKLPSENTLRWEECPTPRNRRHRLDLEE